MIERLKNWEIDPLSAPFLVLETVAIPEEGEEELVLRSNDNRRLYCLKQFQEHVRSSGWIVYVKVTRQELPLTDAVRRFFSHFDSFNDGRDIRVRGGRDARPSSQPPL